MYCAVRLTFRCVFSDEKCFFPAVTDSRVSKKVTFKQPNHHHPHHYQNQHSTHARPPMMESTPISTHHVQSRQSNFKDTSDHYSYINSPPKPKLAIKTFPNTAQYPTNPYNNLIINPSQRPSVQQLDQWKDVYSFKNGGHQQRMRNDSGSSNRSSEDDGGSTAFRGM